jgi:Cas7 group CRISPR-associated protein Csh2
MSTEIKRATGLLVIEVVNSNPNGDPDMEGDPRQRPNGLGEISPVSFKRKLRDLLEDPSSPFYCSLPEEYTKNAQNYRILESRGRDREEIKKEMGDTTIGKFDQKTFLKSDFVKKYWDGRVFGNTFLEEKADKGFIKTGAVIFSLGLSVSPVQIIRHTNTNKAGVQSDKQQGMAPLAYRIVEHGVYCMPFFVNPNYADKTGCTTKDIDLLKLVIPNAYDQTKSAIRPDVRLRHAWYIEHKNILGDCPDYLLIEALTPKRIADAQKPSNSWQDYNDTADLPNNLKSKVSSFADLVKA